MQIGQGVWSRSLRNEMYNLGEMRLSVLLLVSGYPHYVFESSS